MKAEERTRERWECLNQIVAQLRALGWRDDGLTHRNAMGRLRMLLPDTQERVTVGPRTTNFYRAGGFTGFRQFKTTQVGLVMFEARGRMGVVA